MKLKFDVEVPKKRNKSGGNVTEALTEFLQSSHDTTQVQWRGKYKSTSSCYATINNAIRRGRFPLSAKIRGGEVFLVKDGDPNAQ